MVQIEATSIHIGFLMYLMVMLVEGWTYNYSDTAMTWNETRNYCQITYTDIVMIHNENVAYFLKNHLPKRSGSYYWIGIKKLNDRWTWVANGQTEVNPSWANKEPNNEQSNENCVEMYINNTNNTGKWNDEDCEKKKFPVCQKAQCQNNSCSDREDCIEQVNNFTCVCKPGFYGSRCETAVSCHKLHKPQHGRIECSGLYGNHSLNSTCRFFCSGSFKLSGADELRCNSSGAWNVPSPTCTAQCYPHYLLGGGMLHCSEGHDSYRSTCTVQCPQGHLLLGFAEFTCRADDIWSTSLPLICTSYVNFLIACLGCFTLFCCSLFCCSNCRKSRNKVKSRTQQEPLNPI